MKRDFIVKLKVPKGVTLEQTKRYIKEAVSIWGGSFHPDDPFFRVLCTVKVKPKEKKNV